MQVAKADVYENWNVSEQIKKQYNRRVPFQTLLVFCKTHCPVWPRQVNRYVRVECVRLCWFVESKHIMLKGRTPVC